MDDIWPNILNVCPLIISLLSFQRPINLLYLLDVRQTLIVHFRKLVLMARAQIHVFVAQMQNAQ